MSSSRELSKPVFNALIISYLFLGGMGAGSFVVLVCVWAFSSRMALANHASNPLLRPGYRGFLGVGFGVSLAVQLLGVLCLLFDLKRPEAIYYLVIDPQLTAITVGAYALALLVIFTLVLALSRLGVLGVPRVVEGAVALVGAVDSCVVMVYTALLLKSCVGNPFWDSPLIPVLFVLSSLSTGIACVVIVSVLSRGYSASKGLAGKLLSVDLALAVLELVTLVVFMSIGLLSSHVLPAYDELFSGSLAGAFWIGLVGFGILAPAALNVFGKSFAAAHVNPLIVSSLVLVGGVCLRYCIVGAGVLW